MPFYEYECENCKFYKEVMQKAVSYTHLDVYKRQDRIDVGKSE